MGVLTRLSLIGAVLCIAVVGQPFGLAFRPRAKDQAKQLAARIEREKNPGKKARFQVRLARIRLTDAIQEYDAGNYGQGWALLEEYRRQIDLSWKTLESAQGGLAKHFEAYKDLEISLREDRRVLEDLRERVPYPEDQSIKTIAEESSRVHNQVLRVLFPAGTPPQKSKKPRRRGALAAADSAAKA
jgi:hypothetical protein